jgi:hypothetical protein
LKEMAKVVVQAENAKGETITLEGDYSLVSVGRPRTQMD